MNDFPLEERRDQPPMPRDQYVAQEMWRFGKQLAIAFFIIGPFLAALMYPWGQ